jgi:hypothetical protein
MTPELLSGLGGGMVVGIVWFGKRIIDSSGKKMSVDDHAKHCSVIVERLNEGDERFKSISERIDRILELLAGRK